MCNELWEMQKQSGLRLRGSRTRALAALELRLLQFPLGLAWTVDPRPASSPCTVKCALLPGPCLHRGERAEPRGTHLQRPRNNTTTKADSPHLPRKQVALLPKKSLAQGLSRPGCPQAP